MRTGAHAAWILAVAAACSNPTASLIGDGTGSHVSTTGNGSASTGGTGASSGGTSSGTGSTTGSPRFSCDLGDGGLFGEPTTIATELHHGAPTDPIDVGDLNGDGNLDIVAAATISGDVVVLFGNGNGTFRNAVHSQVPARIQPDLGPADIHIAEIGSPFGPTVALWDNESAAVIVETVQSNGELNPIAVLDAGYQGSTGYIQMADFNNDGIIDCADAYGDPYASGVTVYLGNDAGGYTLAAPSPVDVSCYRDCAADFNEDGILDLLMWSTEEPLVLSVHLGRGDGSFSDSALSSGFTGSPTQDVWLMADLNEDGHQDVLIYDSTDGSYSILLGRGDGTFIPGPAPTLTSAWPSALRDLNGDGHVDYVGNALDGVLIALGNGDGTFQPSTVRSAGRKVAQIAVGDVNNDGRPDLIVSDYEDPNITLFLNNCR